MSAAGAQAKAPAARAASKRRPAELVLMHLGRALKVGLCMGQGRGGRRDRIEAVVRIAANAIIADDHRAGRTPNVDRVLRWARRRGLDIDDLRVEQIAVDEVATGYLYSIEDRGDMLRITPEERVQHGVWSLGAYGQTKEERLADTKARKECRRQDRLAKSKAATAARRGPNHVNISAIAREFGLSRPTVRSYKKAFDQVILAGGNWTNFSSFLRSNLHKDSFHYEGIPLSPTEVLVVLGISKSTLYNWSKIPGKIESELKAARPSKAAAALIRQRKKELVSRISDAPQLQHMGDQMEDAAFGLIIEVNPDTLDRGLAVAERRAALGDALMSSTEFKAFIFERMARKVAAGRKAA